MYCTTETGEQFIVEMQNRNQLHFRERALYYLSRALARQGERGTAWQFNLKAVYGVFFMNFNLEGSAHKLRTDVVLSDRDTHELFTDKMRFIFLELPAFQKEETECGTDFERWIYVLKNMETLQRLPFKARKAVFEKLEQIVDIASLSKEDRMKYDESIRVFRDNLVTEGYALKKGHEEGMRQGLQEGRQLGLQEGRQQGLQEGRQQGLQEGLAEGLEKGRLEEKQAIARNLKSLGLTLEAISSATGLSQDELELL